MGHDCRSPPALSLLPKDGIHLHRPTTTTHNCPAQSRTPRDGNVVYQGSKATADRARDKGVRRMETLQRFGATGVRWHSDGPWYE
jgi:hypothetical protein